MPCNMFLTYYRMLYNSFNGMWFYFDFISFDSIHVPLDLYGICWIFDRHDAGFGVFVFLYGFARSIERTACNEEGRNK